MWRKIVINHFMQKRKLALKIDYQLLIDNDIRNTFNNEFFL